ncbi:hypothetical protein RO3G_04453 [Rhizopus delemar RA 99-880]|uniref:PhoD-like phosphatase domain-containing protein n=1 Tax=Rhizopus delemar (strain RA 99-880 / ATCC MYA-4621 / FGSC 9543 / NRRL 43880) TaxID=246409 RepID=I1BU68_RHIO9|nr:hypothetical protein RO3G_04453 [Rhizopus delemar RA 99-880]|eukprot:EIE79748.1 hypothetical protein RO3G_04453 [Rhizopus delemar RA 99-880]
MQTKSNKVAPEYYRGPKDRQPGLSSNFDQLHIKDHISSHFPHIHHHDQPGEIICGPLLRYAGINYVTQQWQGSILIVSTHLDAPPVNFQLIESVTQRKEWIKLRVEKLGSFRGMYHFWRYDVRLPMSEYEQLATYSLMDGTCFEFHLPLFYKSMRFMFYSCNGFSDVPQEIRNKFGEKKAPLWQDVLDRHKVMPFHVMLGGGDQLYQDRMTKEDFMKTWIQEKNPSKRLAMRMTQEMKDGFENFYFWNYIKSFRILLMGMVHTLQKCRIQSVFKHTTIELASEHGMIRGTLPTCNHIISTLGPDIGFLALDCRGERTKFEICRQTSYDTVFKRLNSMMPSTVKHLLVLTGVPLIYPRLSLFEHLMDGAAGFNLATIAGKTGALGNIISGQLNKWNGDPELLDDMNDHWTAGNHVHCCGSGKLFSKDMKGKEEGDPYLMVQIVSSAIVNVPPPQALLTILNRNSSYSTFNGNVEEKMYHLFKYSPNGHSRQNKILMGMRNYCAGYYDEKTKKINFWIQVEKEVGVKGTLGYLVDVPRLLFGQAGYHIYHQNKKQLLAEYGELGGHQQRRHHHFKDAIDSHLVRF